MPLMIGPIICRRCGRSSMFVFRTAGQTWAKPGRCDDCGGAQRVPVLWPARYEPTVARLVQFDLTCKELGLETLAPDYIEH